MIRCEECSKMDNAGFGTSADCPECERFRWLHEFRMKSEEE